jgi:hypothetical protein
MVITQLVRAQIEQLQVLALSRFAVTSKRTAPQWQDPAYVCISLLLLGASI